MQHPVLAARMPIDLLPDDTPEGPCALIAITDAMSVGTCRPTASAPRWSITETPSLRHLGCIAAQLADMPLDETAVLEPLLNDTLYKLRPPRSSRCEFALNAQARDGGSIQQPQTPGGAAGTERKAQNDPKVSDS